MTYLTNTNLSIIGTNVGNGNIRVDVYLKISSFKIPLSPPDQNCIHVLRIALENVPHNVGFFLENLIWPPLRLRLEINKSHKSDNLGRAKAS